MQLHVLRSLITALKPVSDQRKLDSSTYLEKQTMSQKPRSRSPTRPFLFLHTFTIPSPSVPHLTHLNHLIKLSKKNPKPEDRKDLLPVEHSMVANTSQRYKRATPRRVWHKPETRPWVQVLDVHEHGFGIAIFTDDRLITRSGHWD